MNMIKFEKIQDLITRLEKIDGHISFVDGKTYVISCPVGGYFVYDTNECIEISRPHFEQLDGKLKNTFSVISRKDLDNNDTYPIKYSVKLIYDTYSEYCYFSSDEKMNKHLDNLCKNKLLISAEVTNLEFKQKN